VRSLSASLTLWTLKSASSAATNKNNRAGGGKKKKGIEEIAEGSGNGKRQSERASCSGSAWPLSCVACGRAPGRNRRGRDGAGRGECQGGAEEREETEDPKDTVFLRDRMTRSVLVCGRACASSNGSQFTCVTGTKVQILTLLRCVGEHVLRPTVLSLLALLVQKYKY
jgi:hypothetical protein